MEVKVILKQKGPKVWSVKSHQTLYEALDILVKQKIGALLVYDEGENIVGILSERDIMRECYHNKSNFVETRISKAMTTRLIVAQPSDHVDYIMGIMTKNRVRHIPIMEEGKLQGVVSIGDVVKAQLRNSEYENRYLKEYLFGDSGEEPQ
jgi:CBS domain-containing protein